MSSFPSLSDTGEGDGGCNQTNPRGVPCSAVKPGVLSSMMDQNVLSTNWLAVVPSSPPFRQTVWQQWPKVWKIFSTLNRPLDSSQWGQTASLPALDMNMLQISLMRIPLNCPGPQSGQWNYNLSHYNDWRGGLANPLNSIIRYFKTQLFTAGSCLTIGSWVFAGHFGPGMCFPGCNNTF